MKHFFYKGNQNIISKEINYENIKETIRKDLSKILDTRNLSFLIGSGCSLGTNGIPTMKELADCLFEPNADLDEKLKDKVIEVTKEESHKIYQDMIMCDSSIEKKFAKDLMENKDVKYFIKLPGWFKIDTPVGGYNPDWAIMKQNGDVVYMVRETKSTKDQLLLRTTENDKIKCGRKHFEKIGVDYNVATDITNSGI